MDFVLILQTLLLALATAGLYAAIASGLTLEFGVTRSSTSPTANS